MFTTPEIICDIFSFLDKDQIERIQLVDQLWNNIIVRHKSILPFRQFAYLNFIFSNQIYLYATAEDWSTNLVSYIIKFDGTNLSKGNMPGMQGNCARYSQLTVDEVLTNLKDVVLDVFQIEYYEHRLDDLLNLMKLVTTKIGGRFRGRFGQCYARSFNSKMAEIFDNYIIVDKLTLGLLTDSYFGVDCANPDIVQLPSTPKVIRLKHLKFKENEEILNFTCNGKLNGANRLTMQFRTSDTNYGKFIRQWFEYESAFNMITTPEIICDLFLHLHKDQIERIQLVSQFWNNVIIQHKNILPLRQLARLYFSSNSPNEIQLYVKEENFSKDLDSYIINFDGINLIKSEENVSSRYLQLTVDELLKNLNDVVYNHIQIQDCESEDRQNNLLNMMKLFTTKTGGRFRGRFGFIDVERFCSKLDEIVDNYIIVDELDLGQCSYGIDAYIREVCANPEIVELPSTPKRIRLGRLEFQENDKVLNFTCNGKLNGANRLIIDFETPDTNCRNFIRQWFEVYRTHENPISLVGKFEFRIFSGFYYDLVESVFDIVKTFLNNTQPSVKYSLEIKEFHSPFDDITNQYLKRRCVLHETDSYVLVIEMEYNLETDMSSINASNLDQPPCNQMKIISFCVKSL